MKETVKSLRERNSNVVFKPYSDDVIGYIYSDTATGNVKHYYVLNSNLSKEEAIKAYYKLKELSTKYVCYGFILIQKDWKVYVEPNYKFNCKKKKFVLSTLNSKKKVVDIFYLRNRKKYNIFKRGDDK